MTEDELEWLPLRAETDGDWRDIEPSLYDTFDVDFIQTPLPDIYGASIDFDRSKLDDYEYEEGFYHLISKDFISYERGRRVVKRLPDMDRARKLPWARAVIDNYQNDAVETWDWWNPKLKRVERYLWLRACDYVLVFNKYRRKETNTNHAFLITAYHVGGNSTRKKLEKKRVERLNK